MSLSRASVDNQLSENLANAIIGWNKETSEYFKEKKFQDLIGRLIFELSQLIGSPSKFAAFIKQVEDLIDSDLTFENPLFSVKSHALLVKLAKVGSATELTYFIKYNMLNVKLLPSQLTLSAYACLHSNIPILQGLYALKINIIKPSLDENNHVLEILDNWKKPTIDFLLEYDRKKMSPKIDYYRSVIVNYSQFVAYFEYFTPVRIERYRFILEHYASLSPVQPQHELKKILLRLDELVNFRYKYKLLNGSEPRLEELIEKNMKDLLYLRGLLIEKIILSNASERYTELVREFSLTMEQSRRYIFEAAANGSIHACIKMGDHLLSAGDNEQALEWYLSISELRQNIFSRIGLNKSIQLAKNLLRCQTTATQLFEALIDDIIVAKGFLSARQQIEIAFLLLQSPEYSSRVLTNENENRKVLALQRACLAYYQAVVENDEDMQKKSADCIDDCFQICMNSIQGKNPDLESIFADVDICEDRSPKNPLNKYIYCLCLKIADTYHASGNPKMIAWYNLCARLPKMLDFIYTTLNEACVNDERLLIAAGNFFQYVMLQYQTMPFHSSEIRKIAEIEALLAVSDDEEEEKKEDVSEEKKEVVVSSLEELTNEDKRVVDIVKQHTLKLSGARAGLFFKEIKLMASGYDSRIGVLGL